MISINKSVSFNRLISILLASQFIFGLNLFISLSLSLNIYIYIYIYIMDSPSGKVVNVLDCNIAFNFGLIPSGKV